MSSGDTLNVRDTDPNYQNGQWYSICTDSSTGCRVVSDTVSVVVVDPPLLLGSNNNGPICLGDTVQLTAVLGSSAGVTVTWYADTALQVPLPTPFVPNTNQWVYLKASNAQGCTTIDSTFITVHPLSVGNLLPATDSLCEGDALVLRALVTGSQYQWNGPNGYSSTLQQPSALASTLNTAGAYTLELTDTNGCVRYDTLQVIVSVVPTAPSLAPLAPLCVGDSVLLTVTAVTGYQYQWQRWPQGTVVSNTNSYLIDPVSSADSGQYYVTIINGNCRINSSNRVLVEVRDPQAVTVFAGLDQQLCGQANAVLTATGLPTGYLGTWTTNSSATISQPNNSNSTVSNLPLGNSIFYWTVNQTVCRSGSIDSIQITLNTIGTDTAQAGIDQRICLPAPTELHALLASGSSGRWSQSLLQTNAGIVMSTPNQPNCMLSGLVAGQRYEFVWSINRPGCPVHSTDTVVLEVSAAPTALAYGGENIYSCGQDTVALNALLPSGSVGIWMSANSLLFGDSTQAATWATGWTQDTTVVYWTLTGGACRNYSQDSLLLIDNSAAVVATPDFFSVVVGQPATIDVGLK